MPAPLAPKSTDPCDDAIQQCQIWNTRHEKIAQRGIVLFIVLFIVLIFALMAVAIFADTGVFKFWPYVAASLLFVALLATGATQYRTHVNEIVRNEERIFGLLRIRFAALMYENKGYKSEVRICLAKNAFGRDCDYNPDVNKKSRSKLNNEPNLAKTNDARQL